jgi:hypothetical protein
MKPSRNGDLRSDISYAGVGVIPYSSGEVAAKSYYIGHQSISHVRKVLLPHISEDYTGVADYKKGERGFHCYAIAPIGSRRALSSCIMQMNRFRNLVFSLECHQQFQSQALLVLKMSCKICVLALYMKKLACHKIISLQCPL